MKAAIVTAVVMFLFGFGGTVAVHYQLQPPEPEPEKVRDIQHRSPVPLSKPELENQQSRLIEDIDRRDLELDRIRAQHSLAKARAQTLMRELDRYQNERSAFLNAYEERKSDIEQRLQELDTAIAEQVAEQQERQAELSDLDAQYRLDSMLAYPHPLNDSAVLRDYMRQHPRQHLERVQRHYQIILQAPDYPLQDRLHDRLEPLLVAQNEAYDHNPEVLALKCGERFCEIQLVMARPDPYRDYWRSILEAVRDQIDMGAIEDEWVVEETDRITGVILIRRSR